MVRPQTRAQRKTAFIKARMLDDQEWLDIMIGNISTAGLMVKCQPTPPVGATIEIRRRGMAIKGEVVWSMPTRFGLRSFEQIDVEALTAQGGLNVHQTRIETPFHGKLWHWRHRDARGPS